jgi:hypothetical protein
MIRSGCMCQSSTGGHLAEPAGNCFVPIQDFVVDENAERSEHDHNTVGRNVPVPRGHSIRQQTNPLTTRLHRRKNGTRTVKKNRAPTRGPFGLPRDSRSRLVVDAHLVMPKPSMHAPLTGNSLQRNRSPGSARPSQDEPQSPDPTTDRVSSIMTGSPDSPLPDRGDHTIPDG